MKKRYFYFIFDNFYFFSLMLSLILQDFIFKINNWSFLFYAIVRIQGRIQEFCLGGAWIFFFKGMGSGGHLKASEGPGQRPGSSQGAKPPEAPNFSDFRSKIKTNY